MRVRPKKFLLLPFLGSSDNGPRRQRRAHAPKRARPDDDGAPDGQPGQSSTTDGLDPQAANKAANGDARPNYNRVRQSSNLDLKQTKTAREVSGMTEEDIIADYNSPIHMWVVSTLFPLVAGTFGPMASMFNICAISTYWRIVVDPSSAGGKLIKDPDWLIAINVVSLAIAIVANLSLLGQMTDRIRYNISGPVTIVGFFISGIVDIILVCVAAKTLPLRFGPQEVYSQAFYYACFSGAIYIILAFMLSVTGWGIWVGHYSNSFKLSLSQRSLMLQTMLFLSYVLAAAGVYDAVEGWQYLDAVYFVVVTVFTIGFGDYTPKTHLGRSLFFPFAVGGIILVGVIIANIRTVILESASVKVSTRLVEKARFKAIKSEDAADGVYKLKGVIRKKTHDTNDDHELVRRGKEFQLMRAIQREAHVWNRVVSLGFALLAFMVLWFVGAVVFWKAETLGVGGQPWTYFESLYFTFVAQVTIGYGDFEPQDNSSKPAFVFWALIALPTLTVLIGAVGDAVSSVVNWYTTWVGEHATALYDIFVALYQPNNRARDKIRDLIKNPDAHKDEEDKSDDHGLHDVASVENRRLVPLDFDTTPFTEWEITQAEKSFRPFIMVKAMQKIMDDVDADPPKQFSYKEWTWVLKLLGEDEGDEEGHRRVGHPLPEGAEVVEPVREQPNQIWSWIGQESPLMSLEDGSEPKWMLKKLMLALEKELKERSHRHVEETLGSGTLAKAETVSSEKADASSGEKADASSSDPDDVVKDEEGQIRKTG